MRPSSSTKSRMVVKKALFKNTDIYNSLVSCARLLQTTVIVTEFPRVRQAGSSRHSRAQRGENGTLTTCKKTVRFLLLKLNDLPWFVPYWNFLCARITCSAGPTKQVWNFGSACMRKSRSHNKILVDPFLFVSLPFTKEPCQTFSVV